MPSSSAHTPSPLSLSEQLDAMLSGWLERQAARHGPRSADSTASAIVSIAVHLISEIETFCRGWGLSVRQTGYAGAWAVLRVEGRALPVEGFAEITAMYRA